MSTSEIADRIFEILPRDVKAKRNKSRYMKAYHKEYGQLVKRVNATLSKKEFALLRKKAKIYGIPYAACLKEAAFAYFSQKYLVPENVEEKLIEAVLQLRRIGRNINQIARRANAAQKLTMFNAVKSQALLDKLEYKLNKLVRCPLKHGD